MKFTIEAEIAAEAHQKHDLHNRNINARLEPKQRVGNGFVLYIRLPIIRSVRKMNGINLHLFGHPKYTIFYNTALGTMQGNVPIILL